MKHLAIHALAAACLAATAAPALANANSSATMGTLVITLIDLDPNDGITPSLSFGTQGRNSLFSSSQSSTDDVLDGHQSSKVALEANEVLATQTHTDWAWSKVSAMGAANAAGFTALSAQGAADSALNGYGNYLGNALGPSSNGYFTLSANTAVTFSVTTALQTKTTMGYNLDADQGEYAWAHSLLNVYGQVNGIDQSMADDRMLNSSFHVRDDNTTEGMSDSWSGLQSVTFTNWGAVATNAQLQALVQVQGQSATWDGVTPVPEPETYAMLLGGLALIGAVGRRQRRART